MQMPATTGGTPQPINYLACKSYWALLSGNPPALKGVEVGELTAYLNGTSTKLRENLRYAVKIILAELDDLNAEAERQAEMEEERKARKREYERKRREASNVPGVVATGVHAEPQNGQENGTEETLPPITPIKEDSPKETVCVSGISLDSEHTAGAGAGDADTPEEHADCFAGMGNAPKRFVKPTVEEVAAYCAEKGYTFSPDAFVAYYESVGWKIGGKSPMKDWRAACVTWQRRRDEDGSGDAEAEEQRAAINAVPPPRFEMH